MLRFIQGPCALLMVGAAAALSSQAFAQSDSAPQSSVANRAEVAEDQITVRGKALGRYRLELEEAREELIEVYNEQNSDDDNDVTCRSEAPTGSRMTQRVCRSNVQTRAEAEASHAFLNALLENAGRPSANPINPGADAKGAQADAVAASAQSSARIQEELERLARQNRELYRAAVKYVDAEDAYSSARADAARSRTAQ